MYGPHLRIRPVITSVIPVCTTRLHGPYSYVRHVITASKTNEKWLQFNFFIKKLNDERDDIVRISLLLLLTIKHVTTRCCADMLLQQPSSRKLLLYINENVVNKLLVSNHGKHFSCMISNATGCQDTEINTRSRLTAAILDAIWNIAA